MKYERFDMGKFVFRQGDESNQKFYVILAGEVGVLTQANYNNVYDRDKQHYEQTARLTTFGRKFTLFAQMEAQRQAEQEEEQQRNSISPNRPSIHRDSRKMSVSFVKAVTQITGTMKATDRFKEAATRRSILVRRDPGDTDEKTEEDLRLEEFKSMAARFGHLVRVLGKGADFGDAGEFAIIKSVISLHHFI